MNKNVLNFYSILFLLAASALCHSCSFISQKGSAELKHRVVVMSGDSIIEAGVLYNTPKMKLDISKMYCWYEMGKIYCTQGNYTGNLLHGNYLIKDTRSKKLIEKGYYMHGLKHGVWYVWDESGNLVHCSEWENGHEIASSVCEQEGENSVRQNRSSQPQPAEHKNNKGNILLEETHEEGF